MDTLERLQKIKIDLNTIIKFKELDGSDSEDTVLSAYQDEVPEAVQIVKDLVKKHFGHEEQYLFWYMMDMLACPTSADTADDMLKPLKDLKVL